MHSSALYHGKLFFDLYCSDNLNATVVDIGAQNVNGSLKDVCPRSLKYIGVDFVEGKGVDVILNDPYKLPFKDNSIDIIVCNSCFEHSQFFWLLFMEMVRSLKSEGLLYLNVPSNGSFHRYPVDCWRFYPDAGQALVAWANREGYALSLIESFIGAQSESNIEDGGAWHDFVAVFIKSAENKSFNRKKMVDELHSFTNGYSSVSSSDLNQTFISPDHHKIISLNQALAERETQIANLCQALSERDKQIFEILSSKSWLLTKPLRAVSRFFRG